VILAFRKEELPDLSRPINLQNQIALSQLIWSWWAAK